MLWVGFYRQSGKWLSLLFLLLLHPKQLKKIAEEGRVDVLGLEGINWEEEIAEITYILCTSRSNFK